MTTLSDILCDVRGSTDAELWYMLREASRQNTYAWNACSILESRNCKISKRTSPCAKCGSMFILTYEDGSTACSNINAHRTNELR